MSHQLLPVSPPVVSIRELFNGLKAHAPQQRKLSVKARIKRLDALYAEVWRRRDDLKRAMWDDFQKPPQEVDLTEIFVLKQEIKAIKKEVKGQLKGIVREAKQQVSKQVSGEETSKQAKAQIRFSKNISKSSLRNNRSGQRGQGGLRRQRNGRGRGRRKNN